MDQYNFPSEFCKPEEKARPEYGVQAVKAMYYTNNRYGNRLFDQDQAFESLIDVALGRLSSTDLYSVLGINKEMFQVADGPMSLSNIDVKVLNLGPKYVNRAVAKIMANRFDISLEAIDLVSIDERMDFSSSLQSFYRQKDWVKRMGVPLEQAFPDLDVMSLPDHADELLYDISTNPKLKKEIAGELAIQAVAAINRQDQKLRQAVWDYVATGWGHIHCYQDERGIPRFDRIDHRLWGGSFVETNDFEDQEYAFFIDTITVNQFIREAGPYFTENELRELVARYSVENSSPGARETVHNLNNFDNLSYMNVVRFYFLSEDSRTYVTKNNQYGSKILLEKDYNYQPDEFVRHRYAPGGDSKIWKNTYTNCYGGTWILDSDVVYNYGVKKTPRTNLVDTTLPIKTVATNMNNGKVTSFTAQMVEPIFMINVAWNKIKETLAKGYLGIRQIDLSALEAVALGRGGRAWDPREVFEYLNLTNTAIGRRSTGNPYGQSNGDIVTHTDTGLLLADYFTTLTVSINMLEQMTGTNLAESAQTPDRLAVGVMEASRVAGDLDMEYLFNSYEYLYTRLAHMNLLYMQEALKDPSTRKMFFPALGASHIAALIEPEDMAYSDYIFNIKRQPGTQEWLEFYQDVRESLKSGEITLADSAMIREIDNLKQARRLLVVRERIRQRERLKEAEANNQMAMEANQRAASDKFQYESSIMERQSQLDAELMQLKGKIDSMLLREKSSVDLSVKRYQEQVRRQNEADKNKTTLIRTGMETNVEAKKVDKRKDKSPED